MKSKKSNAGRKPVLDKKVQVSLYVPKSQIEKFGTIEEFKIALYDFIAARSLSDREDYKQGWTDCLEVNNLDSKGRKR